MNQELGSVLIVDDDPRSRQMLSRVLTQNGIHTSSASDGREALDLINGHRIDLVLLDTVMPDLDGLAVLNAIRQARSPAELPVIMATVKDQSRDLVEALKLGANDYVTKPFDYPVVVARVRTHLSLKHSVDKIVELEKSLELRNQDLQVANRDLAEANRRMKSDLEAAANIQKALLPDDLPNFPQARFAWGFKPCEELAGDLLNIFPLDANRISFYLLDVVGHGVAAALLAVTVNRVLARMLTSSADAQAGTSANRTSPAPADVVAQLNREFAWDTKTQQFFTLIYGHLDGNTRECRFVSAGFLVER